MLKRLPVYDKSRVSKLTLPVLVHWFEGREKEVRRVSGSRPKWSHLKDASDYNHCYVCKFIYQCYVHKRQVHI
jgi:hypothetical protein